MNWNYWLPWRDYPQDDNEDLSYEEEVMERCDHDFEQTTARLGPDLANATIENGYLVVPVNEGVEEFCEKCGEPGYQGEPDRYKGRAYDVAYTGEWPYEAVYTGEWTRVSHHLVFEPAFEMDPDLSVGDALTEPVEADADFEVDEDGETTTVSREDEGRVIVNTSEKIYGVTE